MKDLSPEEKKSKGKEIKELFETIDTAFQSKQKEIKNAYWNEQLSKEIVDISTP
jgi:phenylalanyl-tRNA synthetase alpha subunit